MSLDDARLLALAFRGRLFQAIRDKNFESVPALGREYFDQVRSAVHVFDASASSDLEVVLRAPLIEGIRYLRVVRAHQSAAFRKLAQDKMYAHSTELRTGRSTLHVSA